MGRFYPGVIGECNGKVGGIVVRSMNHKKFYSVRPCKYRKSTNPSALRTRNNFSTAAKLAKYLVGIPALYSVWNASSIAGASPYHKLLKTNINYVKEGLLTEHCMVFPPSRYLLELNASLIGNTCVINFGKIESTVTHLFSKELTLQMIFILFKGDNGNENCFSLQNHFTKINDVSFEYGSELIIPLPENLHQEIILAPKRVLFLSFIPIKETDSQLAWTSSPSIIF